MSVTINDLLHTILSSCTLSCFSPELRTLSAKRVFFWEGEIQGRDPTRLGRGAQSCGNEALRVEEISFSSADAVVSIQFNIT